MPITTPSRFLISLLLAAAATACAATHSSLGPSERARAFALPERADVPHSPDVTVERFAIIAAPAGHIYQLLVDVERWSEWDPNVTLTRAHARRPLQAGDAFFQNPGGYRVEARVLEAQPGQWLRWRGGTAIVGVHSYRLIPLDAGRTLVIDREEFSSWVLRPIAWLGDLGVGDQFQRTLSGLQRRAEIPATAAR